MIEAEKSLCPTLNSQKITYFFHTQLWFPAADCDLQRFGSDFRRFCNRKKSYHKKKTLWKKWYRSWVPMRNGVHLHEFVFHKITHYCLWFLEYKLARAPKMDSLYLARTGKLSWEFEKKNQNHHVIKWLQGMYLTSNSMIKQSAH